MSDLLSFGFGSGLGSGIGGLTSVGLSMPSAFSVTNSPLIANGVLNVIGAGSTSQYIDGTGALKTFPTNIGGGSAVVYYLNGSVNQGVIDGGTYYEINKTAVFVPNADFSTGTDGLIAQFITDSNDPQLPLLPNGAWQFQLYFSASSSGGNPRYYVELYKYDGVSFSLISSNSSSPESITGGTSIDLYTTLLPTPETTLALTDRIVLRVYVITDGRTLTLHTQDVHICKITTTFTYGIVSLNGLTDSVQYFQTGTSGTDFGITQSGVDTHVFNLPVASATNTGKLSNTDWVTFNNKYNLPALTSGSVLFSDGTNISQDNSNLFWDNSTKKLGIGTNTPLAKLHLTNGSLGNTTLYIQSTGLNDGIVIDSGEYPFLSFRVLGVQNFGIQGLGGTEIYFRPSKNLEWRAVDTNSSVFGSINMDVSANSYSYYLHNLILGGSTTPSEKLQLASGNFLIANGSNIILGTTSGTKIGTATTQKLGFYNATPIVQPASVTTYQGVADALTSLGLLAPSTLNGALQNLNFGSNQWTTTAPATTLPSGQIANGFAFFTDLASKNVSGTTTYDEYFIWAGRKLTLTGTSGTANINILGVDYLATFTTDLTTTANNFVTTYQATLLALGIQVFANTGILRFGKQSDAVGGSVDLSNITITTLTGNLSGTFDTTTNDHVVVPYATKPYFNQRLNHTIRINFNIDTGNLQYYSLSLRRWQNDSIIGSIIQVSRNASLTGQQWVFVSYTAGATDPFVTGGFYFALENQTGQNVTISGSAGILIETYYQKPLNF